MAYTDVVLFDALSFGGGTLEKRERHSLPKERAVGILSASGKGSEATLETHFPVGKIPFPSRVSILNSSPGKAPVTILGPWD